VNFFNDLAASKWRLIFCRDGVSLRGSKRKYEREKERERDKEIKR
jgi:hypothetical protein